MKGAIIVFAVIFLAAGYANAVESGNIPAAQQPIVKEVTGKGEIMLEAAIYPEFMPIDVDPRTESGCQTADSSVFKALRLQPITTASPSTGNPVKADTAKLGRQETDLKIRLTGKEIPEGYRKSAKILVTWTVRIEGKCPAWGIGHVICEPWIGSIKFSCPEGDVKTYLKATYKDKESGAAKGGIIGSPVVMTMPPTEKVSLQNDPTLTGTYVITAEDFPNGQIPEDLELTILWENFTALQVYSPGGMRTMIVNVIPVTKK
ncbi:MAG: hypothetical protein PHS64_00050 [Candidatus Omnitrophica bacterium]|nr:hypothetical protein [Candidatus Omnitrophota bacterium]MDD5774315.1 hypothetical protein [Candidatus Omnitrophota bacterium]